MTRSQQDVDRILKCVDTKITEFTNCWQKAKVDAVSRLSHSQCEKLKELSSALQQQRSQLLSLCSKSGMRKSQRREVDAAQGSIDNALENFEAFERELNQDGDIVKEDVNLRQRMLTSGPRIQAEKEQKSTKPYHLRKSCY
jgi:septum formation inhibitor MinC